MINQEYRNGFTHRVRPKATIFRCQSPSKNGIGGLEGTFQDIEQQRITEFDGNIAGNFIAKYQKCSTNLSNVRGKIIND